MAPPLGERLVAAGLTTPAAVEQALQQQKVSGHRLGDCLVELGLIAEGALLRFLAAEFQTRYVTTEKLAATKISPDILDRVPVRVAEAQCILPVAYDAENRLLSIVASEPQNRALLDELRIVTNVEEVVAYIGLKRSISAAIRRNYYGDPTAFEAREPPSATREESSVGPKPITRTGTQVSGPRDTNPRAAITGVTQVPSRFSLARDAALRGTPDDEYAQTVAVLVGLLEQAQGSAGHAARISACALAVARQLDLPSRELTSLRLVATLHGLGAKRHLTLASIGKSDAERAEARRMVRAPVDLLGGNGMPPAHAPALLALLEAFDGSGAVGMKASEIPLVSRIVAAVDCVLTELRAEGASREAVLGALAERSGKLFDPGVAAALLEVLSGEPLRRALLHAGRRVVVVEPAEDRRRELLGRLRARGLDAQGFERPEDLAELILRRAFDVLLLSFDAGMTDCLSALQLARSQPETAGLPIVLFGELDKALSDRLMSAGGTVALNSVDPEAISAIAAAQLASLVSTGGAGRPVVGSSDQLALSEALATLGAASGSGKLSVLCPLGEGTLHLEQGHLVAARLGELRDQPALDACEQAAWCDFTYDPEALLLEIPTLRLPLAG